MNICDFEYDGQSAKNMGLAICTFGSGGGDFETNSAGSEINFHMTPVGHGEYQLFPDTSYDNVIEATFQVCKLIDCKMSPLTFEDQRNIARWLNRKEVHKTCFLDFNEETSAYDYVEFEGSFNLQEVKMGEHVYGYTLTFISNRPYALGRIVQRNIKATTTNFKYRLYDDSDEIGHVYPTKLTIKCKAAGTLEITNSIEDRTTVIKNCSIGEVITIDKYMNISTSIPSHKIQNDFNYCYFRVANKYDDRMNVLTISIPCEIKLEYSPIIKGVGL